MKGHNALCPNQFNDESREVGGLNRLLLTGITAQNVYTGQVFYQLNPEYQTLLANPPDYHMGSLQDTWYPTQILW